MKRIYSILGFVLFVCFLFGNELDVKAESIEDNYFEDRVVHGSEVKLTDEQLEFVYNTALSVNNLSEYGFVSPSNIDGGGNAGTIIEGPYRSKVSNVLERYAVSMFAVWIGEKIPPARPYAYLLATGVFLYSEHLPDRFVSTWTWKVWDTSGYVPAYRKYTTAVEYTDWTFSKIKKMYTYDAGYY